MKKTISKFAVGFMFVAALISCQDDFFKHNAIE